MGQEMPGGAVQQDEPLELAWRHALRWRPLTVQFIGTLVAFAVAALGFGVASMFASGTGQVLSAAAGLIVAFLVTFATNTAVMAIVSAQDAADESFLVGSFVVGVLDPVLVVGGVCAAGVVLVSIFFQCVPILLGSTDKVLGHVIFALANVPMYMLALIELMLVLASLFVFPPLLVDAAPHGAAALQRFLDSIVACRLADVVLRLKAFVRAALIALPILTALAICQVYISLMSYEAGVNPCALASSNLLVGFLLVMSWVTILAAALSLPLAYLNAACLMVHRSAQG
jgi:hypothetical protein